MTPSVIIIGLACLFVLAVLAWTVIFPPKGLDDE